MAPFLRRFRALEDSAPATKPECIRFRARIMRALLNTVRHSGCFVGGCDLTGWFESRSERLERLVGASASAGWWSGVAEAGCRVAESAA